MKKAYGFIMLIVFCLFMYFPINIMAVNAPVNSNKDGIVFEVTGGIDTEKDIEVTFDKIRTIIGTGEKGTAICISVYRIDYEGEVVFSSKHDIDIGYSELFTQTVALDLDINYIEIVVTEPDKEPVTYTFVVKRKSEEIKKKIENKQIILPLSP